MTVVLRAFGAADEAALTVLFAEPAVRLWNPPPAGLHVPTWCATRNAVSPTSRTWAVADPGDDRLLGTVSVFSYDVRTGEAEIGYRVLAAEAGRGVATHAVRAAVRRAGGELGVTSLRLFHAIGNPASCRVALKAGFVLAGGLCGLVPYGDGRRHEEHLHQWVPAESFNRTPTPPV